jgi:hypothetical protein
MGDLSDILELLQSMGLVLGLAFYVAIVIWTYKDARKRTEDPILVATFTAVGMLPVFGVFIYMLVRPSEYLADVRERELEIRALERQLGRHERCPYCRSHIEAGYLSCPVCTTKLRQRCTGCESPLDPRWVLCPFCETEVPGKVDGAPAGGKPGRGARVVSRDSSAQPAERTAPASAKPEPRAATKSRPAPRPKADAGDAPAKRDASTTRPRRSRSSASRESGPATPDATIATEPLSAGPDAPTKR